jgi:micrococcal nuclease
MIRQQYIFSGLVNRVIDGDTYDITLDLGFYVSHRIRVRLKGVDTPEVYG